MAGPSNARSDAKYLLNDLLRDVSRSFYLTLRLLPGAVRPQIGLAYLLARATDTIADSGAITVAERLEMLRRLKAQIAMGASERFQLKEILMKQSSAGEKVLLTRINEVLSLLAQLEPYDRQLVREVLATITSGQELDLQRFGGGTSSRLVALQTEEELDDYTYRVAGCVGEFWTRMCEAHLSPKPRLPLGELIAKGVRFGKGLQLVNILRDLPADLRLGRCYLPEERLRGLNLRPEDLLDQVNEQRLKPMYDELVSKAEEHLKIGWEYVLALPRSWVRVRLACALPVLIGVKTLNKLREGNVLNPDTRIKVSRAEVKRIMRATILFYPVNSAWKNLPARVAGTK